MNKLGPLVGTLLAVVVAVCGVAQDAETEPSVLVTTIPLAKHRLANTITAYGRVQSDPDKQRSILVAHDGIAGRIRVRAGERVNAGAPLIEIETAPGAWMTFQQAKAAVEFARGEVERLNRMFAEQLATTDQVAAARNNLRQAEAAFEAQNRQGAGASREIVRAPYDAIVINVLVNQGEHVAANASVAIIAQSDALLIPLGIEPEDASRVKPGMAVTVASLFQPDLVINGKFERAHAMINPATRLVDAIVRVDGPDATHLVLGVAVKGTIVLNELDAFAVPRDAVLRDGKGDHIFVVRNDRAHRIAVQTSIEQDGLVGIVGHLQAGERVVVSGNYQLRDGMKVRFQP